MILRYVKSFVSVCRHYGLKVALLELKKKFRQWWKRYIRNPDIPKLQRILREHDGMPVIIFNQSIDWNIPLKQRPQHLAIHLARQGFLYFYCTSNMYDDYSGFVQLEENLYVTDCYDELVDHAGSSLIFHVYAQNPHVQTEFIVEQLQQGNHILYEYIDEIHDDLGFKRESVIDRHLTVLRDERCMVVVTASKLLDEVLCYRHANYALVSNGVDVEHFGRSFLPQDAPEAMQPLLVGGQVIIGYFGALASWFDYALVRRLAMERPDYQIVLVGWDYDKSLQAARLDDYRNITVIGPINYQELPKYAHWFSISIIPFKINEVTESTSPIKLFEYMALGYPIVTTDLPECRKYRSVMIGRDHGSFIEKIDEALSLRQDEVYRALLRREAQENTWEEKANTIAVLIYQNLKRK